MIIKSQWRINPVYRPFIDDQTRTQILFGGSSSGKSRFIAQRLVYDLINGERNYLVVRNTGRTNRSTTFNEINTVISDWKLSKYFKINKSEMTITCMIAKNRQVFFMGLDDVEKLKGITPENDGVITDVWIEEATETSEDDCNQLRKRLRGDSKVSKRMTYSFNPIMRSHWIFKRFFQNMHDSDKDYRDPDLAILRTTYKDNCFLAPDDIKDLENETNEYYRDVYTLGKWGVLGHLIFTNWHVEDMTGLRDAFGTYHNGLDFGFTNDPTALARCARKEKKLYITHEMYEFGMTNDLIAAGIKPIISNEAVRCDPSSPKDIAELRGYGINATAASGGKGSVNHGIQFIQQYEVIIDRTCQNAINEFQLYQWDKNKQGETMNQPIDKHNHFIDALRYALSGISFTQAAQKESHFERRYLGLPV